MSQPDPTTPALPPELQASRAELVTYGQVPEQIASNLQAELEALEAHLHQRQSDWLIQQPQRDWSPAQEAEHVLLVNDSVINLVLLLLSNKELPEMPKRLGKLKNGKRQAPSFTLPSQQGLAWDDLPNRWGQQSERLIELAANAKATPQRFMWHPFLGDLDALDWLRMLVRHTRGHRQLLEKSFVSND